MRKFMLFIFVSLFAITGCEMKKEPTDEEKIVAAYEKKHKDIDSEPMFSQVDLDVAEAASMVDAIQRKLKAGDVVAVNEMLSQAESKIKGLLESRQDKTAAAYAMALKAFLKGNASLLSSNKVRFGSLAACVDTIRITKEVGEASDSMVKVYEHINDSARKIQASVDSALAVQKAKADSAREASLNEK